MVEATGHEAGQGGLDLVESVVCREGSAAAVTAPYSSVGPYSNCHWVARFSGSTAPWTTAALAPPLWATGVAGSPTVISSTSVAVAPPASVTVSDGK